MLLREVIQSLALEPGLTVLDGTVGGGGHSRRILEAIGPSGQLIGLDRDPMMLELARQNLMASGLRNFQLKHASYSEMESVLKEFGLDCVDRVLLDLGLSSDQLNDPKRGFGIESQGALDLRFDTSRGVPAWKYLKKLSEQDIANLIHQFGEERFSRAIAGMLSQAVQSGNLRTVDDLARVVDEAIPKSVRGNDRRKILIRVVQSLRIAVNDELGHLKDVLENSLYQVLSDSGRVAIISFHSLEDRLVKTEFRDKSRWENLTPKPIEATSVEKKVNPRCRTAKLRVAKKRETKTVPR
ncbi:MAG: 16S rRNA (cytosine(1402)-N(4))-methyltransferase RsmH [Planctomycetaceae bacterium]